MNKSIIFIGLMMLVIFSLFMDSSGEENLAAIDKALREAGNTDVTIKELQGLNHLFQKASTGLPSEYVKISETINPEALTLISSWILEILDKIGSLKLF